MAGPIDRFSLFDTAPVLLTMAERIVLYSTVLGLRPKRSLEIGTHKGGSALIICAALDDIGAGQLICVDPNPLVSPECWAQLQHRTTLLSGPSPGSLSRARESAGGSFDFAFIDGDHESPGVVADIEATLPLLSSGAYLLFHDAHYYGVADAIAVSLARHRDSLADCGLISREQTPEGRVVKGRPVIWGGLQLLRYRTGS